jgi:hypothetical protein
LWYAKQSEGKGWSAMFGTVHIAYDYVHPLIRVLVTPARVALATLVASTL